MFSWSKVALYQGFKDLPTKLWKTLVISPFFILQLALG
jgi:hypothetical protein